jgi:putative FmdB family regulatory protein
VPTYEYECGKCRRVFEIRQRISDPPLETCEVCGGAVRRLLSPAPFILKGGGWYVTDYPSQARKKALESEKSAAGKGEKADKKTDTTPSPTTTASTPTTASAPAPSSDSTKSD